MGRFLYACKALKSILSAIYTVPYVPLLGRVDIVDKRVFIAAWIVAAMLMRMTFTFVGVILMGKVSLAILPPPILPIRIQYRLQYRRRYRRSYTQGYPQAK